jgi:hypothetical protein
VEDRGREIRKDLTLTPTKIVRQRGPPRAVLPLQSERITFAFDTKMEAHQCRDEAIDALADRVTCILSVLDLIPKQSTSA